MGAAVALVAFVLIASAAPRAVPYVLPAPPVVVTVKTAQRCAQRADGAILDGTSPNLSEGA